MISTAHSANGKPRRVAGFTLLEVLVALVVLSIGLLGLSGLQTSSLRNNHAAFLRSQATLLKADIVDRMRANRDSATAGDYDISYTATPTVVSCVGSCSAQQVAQMDLLEWRAYVERLPGGESEVATLEEPIVVDGNPVTVDVAEIKVRWADTRDSANKLELVSRVQL
jgi:type IV pilus assembly protein PilV